MAKRLEQLMVERKVTQAALARAVGVTEAAVYFWLVGLRIPSLPSARQVARFFGVSLDDLVFPGEMVRSAGVSKQGDASAGSAGMEVAA